MARNHTVRNLSGSATVAALGSELYEIDTKGMDRLTVFVRYGWDVVHATLLGVNIIQRYGATFPGVEGTVYAENEDEIPNLPQPTALATNTSNVWQWNIPLDLCPRFIQLEVENEDGTTPMDLEIVTDSGAL